LRSGPACLPAGEPVCTGAVREWPQVPGVDQPIRHATGTSSAVAHDGWHLGALVLVITPSDLRITSGFSCVARGFQPRAVSPHRTDCCRSIRRRGGVKGRFACTLTGHLDLCSLPSGQIGA